MHAVQYWEIHDCLGREFRYSEAAGAYEGPDGFRLLSGAELSIAQGCDLIVLATVGQLRELDGALTKPATHGYRHPFAEAVAAAHAVGAFVIGAHMVRPGKELAKVGKDKLGALDALELNGKDFIADDRVRTVAAKLRVPVVGGSDAHFWAQVGIKATVLAVDDLTQTSVASEIRTGRTAVESQGPGPIACRSAGRTSASPRRERPAPPPPIAISRSRRYRCRNGGACPVGSKIRERVQEPLKVATSLPNTDAAELMNQLSLGLMHGTLVMP